MGFKAYNFVTPPISSKAAVTGRLRTIRGPRPCSAMNAVSQGATALRSLGRTELFGERTAFIKIRGGASWSAVRRGDGNEQRSYRRCYGDVGCGDRI